MSGVSSFLAVAGYPNTPQGALTLTHGAYFLATAQTNESAPGNTFYTGQSSVADFNVTNLSGNWGGVVKDYLCLLGSQPLLADIGIARFRKNPGSVPTVLNLGEMSTLDQGLTSQLYTSDVGNSFYWGNSAPPVGSGFPMYFTAVRQIGLYQIPPKTIYSGGSATFYKDFDLAYSAQGTSADPVPICGNHMVLFGTGTQPYFSSGITITISGWAGTDTISSLSSPGWLPYWDGNDPSGISVSGLTITIKNLYPGFHILEIPVVSSAGALSYAFRYIWVFQDDSPTGLPQFSYPFPVAAVKSDNHTADGRQIQIQLNADSYKNIPRSSMVMYFERTMKQSYDPTPAVTQMPGWIDNANSSADSNTHEMEFTLFGPGEFLNRAQGTAFLLTNGGLAGWYNIASGLTHTQYTAAYILRYHVRGWLELFDLHINTGTNILNTPTVGPYGGFTPVAPCSECIGYIQVNQGTILEQIRNVVARVMLFFNIDSNGHMWMLPHPSDVYQATYSVTLDGSTYSKVAIKHKLTSPVRHLRAEGLGWDGTNTTAYLADAPGPVPSQGQNEQSLQSMYVSFAHAVVGAQQTLNLFAGLAYTRLNNPFSDIELTIPRNESRFDPAQFPIISFSVVGASIADIIDVLASGLSIQVGNPWLANVVSVARTHKADGTIDTVLTIELLVGSPKQVGSGATAVQDFRWGTQTVIPAVTS